jgi:hypothetical protein
MSTIGEEIERLQDQVSVLRNEVAGMRWELYAACCITIVSVAFMVMLSLLLRAPPP